MAPFRGLRAGHTMVELAVVWAILAVLFLAALLVAMTGQDSARSQTVRLDADRSARLAFDRVTRLLEETSPGLVHSGERTKNPVTGSWSHSSTFGEPATAGLSQCPNPACSWVLDPGTGNTIVPNAWVSSDYARSTASPGGSLTLAGRTWRNEPGAACPRCNALFAAGGPVRTDGVWFLSARDAGNAFVRNEGSDNAPDWQAMVLLFPRPAGAGGPGGLARHVFYRNDLLDLAKVVAQDITASWTAWSGNNPPGVPTFHNLLDFDSDGQIETDVAATDATSESLFLQGIAGNQIVYRKSWSSGPSYRIFDLSIDRETGRTIVSVDQGDAGGARWYRKLDFTREPEVLAAGFADWDVATWSDDRYDAVANPLGVAESLSVRITMVFDRLESGRGGSRHQEAVLTTLVSPRN